MGDLFNTPLTKEEERIIRGWIEDLRSGEYEKGRGALRKSDEGGSKFCCLGVLCDRHAKEIGGVWRSTSLIGIKMYLGHIATLPEEISRWAGLNLLPRVTYENRWVELDELNDNEGLTFAQIADMIESELERALAKPTWDR